jgi:peptidyl-prolyl cis-trans isomerase A (cyclophilin A)
MATRRLLRACLALIALSACNSGPKEGNPALWDPSLAKAEAPATFSVKFDTSAGEVTVTCHREWAPHGVDRFYNLVSIGYYDDVTIFRVVTKPTPFVAQFGIHGTPGVNSGWEGQNLPADPPKETNRRGTLTYAMAGSPNTRTTQLFFNLGNNQNLDKMGFAPICEVAGDGMNVVDKFHAGYGETPSRAQGKIAKEGNAFLRAEFPNLSVIRSARIVP